jgi:hypothetical protein
MPALLAWFCSNAVSLDPRYEYTVLRSRLSFAFCTLLSEPEYNTTQLRFTYDTLVSVLLKRIKAAEHLPPCYTSIHPSPATHFCMPSTSAAAQSAFLSALPSQQTAAGAVAMRSPPSSTKFNTAQNDARAPNVTPCSTNSPANKLVEKYPDASSTVT